MLQYGNQGVCWDKSLSVEPQELVTGRRYFQGYESLQKEQQLLDLAGVSYGTYDFLLERTLVPSDNCKFSEKNSNPEIHN